MVSLSVVVCFAVIVVAAATDVKQCRGRNIANLQNDVQLSPCTKPPCKLRKGTNQNITIKFTPDADLDDVMNHVTADIKIGFPVPFVGVDSLSICSKIFTEEGEPAACPLKAGTTYIYKDSFPVLEIYPTLSVDVHWELTSGDKSLACFEVPAKIINAKRN